MQSLDKMYYEALQQPQETKEAKAYDCMLNKLKLDLGNEKAEEIDEIVQAYAESEARRVFELGFNAALNVALEHIKDRV